MQPCSKILLTTFNRCLKKSLSKSRKEIEKYPKKNGNVIARITIMKKDDCINKRIEKDR